MSKTAQMNTRIDPRLKSQAESVLSQLGLSISDAITIYFRQIVMQQGLPFDVKVPNASTRQALERVRNREGLAEYDNADELLDDMESW